jgi:hypothetical protein
MSEVAGQRSEGSGTDIGARGKSLVEDGVLAGAIGAAVVAVFFLLIDTLRGQPLHTPSLLGSVLFLRQAVEEVTSVSATMVFAYTGLHVLLFLMVGALIAWIVDQFERNPQFGLVLVLLFLLFQAVIFGFEVTLVPNLVGALGAGVVGIANVLSVGAMFWFLLRRHPEAMEQLRQSWNE